MSRQPDAATTAGWGWPALSKKAHYFEDATSLCRRWRYSGGLENCQAGRSKDDCAACWKVLDRRAKADASRAPGEGTSK